MSKKDKKRKEQKTLIPAFLNEMTHQQLIKYSTPETYGMTVEFLYMNERYRGTVYRVKDEEVQS